MMEREFSMDIEDLKKELEKKRSEMYRNWNRVLPTNELLFDRWEKAGFLNFGENSSCYDTSIIMGDVRVANNVWIGPYTLLDGTGGGLTIGEYCSISAGVQIYTHDTVKWSLSGGKTPKIQSPVVIGNRCYIAPMSIISMGATIGDCSVVSANSFVNRSFPDHSIIAGTPARKIGEIIELEDGEIKMHYYKVEED
jgi:acetyltransferase-like isoleucine patch superfamily enzyme